MDNSWLGKKQTVFTAVAILIFMAVAFGLRMIPSFFSHDTGFFPIYEFDSWYTIRQVELMVANYPHYAWFDPMTSFPLGKSLDWGPLLPALAATACILLGAGSRDAIIHVSMLMGPFFAALMVPLTCLIAIRIWGSVKTGIIAAGLIAVISLQYFASSTYGIVDHHVLELFTSSLFVLAYLAALHEVPVAPAGLKDWTRFLILCCLSGATFFLGLLNMPTMIIFALIIALYTFVHVLSDFFSDRTSEAILVLNTITFALVIFLLWACGLLGPGLSLTQYTWGQAAAYLALIGGTLVLYTVSRILHKRKILFIAAILCMILGFYPVLSLDPALQSNILWGTYFIFGQLGEWNTIIEMQPWTPAELWANYGAILIFAAGGLLALGISLFQDRSKKERIFLMVWSVFVLIITLQHRRFDFYFVIIAALLSSLCIATLIDIVPWRQLAGCLSAGSPSGDAAGKKQKGTHKAQAIRPGSPSSLPVTPVQGCAVLLLVLLVPFIVIGALGQDYAAASTMGSSQTIPKSWMECLDWLGTHTPVPGIEYSRIYERTGFAYPPGAYGIVANWEKGHWITFFSKRIPVTNPFQENLAGESGVAAFYYSENESSADAILKTLGGRYVITDTNQEILGIYNFAIWNSPDPAGMDRYRKGFLAADPSDPSRLTTVRYYDDRYYHTMIVRLHQFDGSLAGPSEVSVIDYRVQDVAGGQETGQSHEAPVIQRVVKTDIAGAGPFLNSTAAGGAGTIVLSDRVDRPISEVSALQHYRLVHESPYYAQLTMMGDGMHYEDRNTSHIKVFEFVPGARIRGEGIIELPVVTNTGRSFTYRQASTNGEFVVPYATTGGSGDVKTAGPYRIAGTTRDIRVTEDDVISGKIIS